MSFLNELKSEWKKAVIGLIVVFVIAKWEAIVSTFDTGKQIEAQIEFESMLITAFKNDSIAAAFMNNQRIVEIIFKAPKVQAHIDKLGEDLEKEIHDKIVVDVTKSDSNKVSMRSFVGMGAGIRDEQVLPIITEIVKEYNEKKFAKKNEVRGMIRQSVKTEALNPVVF